MSEPLTDLDIDKMEKDALDASQGYNTYDIARRYARDVRRLIDERYELLKRLQEMTRQNEQLQATLNAKKVTPSKQP